MSIEIEGPIKDWKTVVIIIMSAAVQYGALTIVVVVLVQCSCDCLWSI